MSLKIIPLAEVRKRHHQSLAAVTAVQARLVAALKDGQAKTTQQLQEAEATATRLRPAIKKWVESGLKAEERPSDEDLQAYLDAVHQAHELRLADNAAYHALREHEEMADPEPEKD